MNTLAKQIFRLHARDAQRPAFAIWQRSMSTVQFDKLGSATSVLKVCGDDKVGALSANEVAVKMLAAAVTPADLTMVAGLSDLRPKLPAVGGLSGVGQVTSVGAGVSDLKVGDTVLPLSPAFGCWRTEGKANEASLAKLPADIPVEKAASILSSYCVAYRLLTDFATLNSGDVVVQNGAETAVGQAVIQIAKKQGLKTVNIVSSDAVSESALQALGADVVITEEQASTMAGRQALSQFKAPTLAVNTVGGTSVLSMAKSLGFKGTLVTYGGLSRQAVEIPTTSLIFNDISARGFTLSRWLAFASPDEVSEMVCSVADIVKSSAQSPNISSFSFSEFTKAVEAASEAGIASNVIVKM